MNNQLCCRCQKRPAVKSHEEISDGVAHSYYYCLNCYQEMFLADKEAYFEQNSSSSVCPECGMNSQEFFSTGLVGCANCYKYLEKDILPTIVKLQGGRVHCGKRTSLTEEREELILKRNAERRLVESCLAEHRYEDAQQHLNKLKELNKRLYGGQV